jgi:hypothetical protein
MRREIRRQDEKPEARWKFAKRLQDLPTGKESKQEE